MLVKGAPYKLVNTYSQYVIANETWNKLPNFTFSRVHNHDLVLLGASISAGSIMA